MATSKTLKPTNQTINIPELSDAPNMAVPADAISKEADAINALSEHLELIGKTTDNEYVPRIYRMTMTANGGTHKIRLKSNHLIFILLGFIGTSGCACLLIRSFGNNIDKKIDVLNGGNYTGTLLSFAASNNEVTITNNAAQPSQFTVIVGGAVS